MVTSSPSVVEKCRQAITQSSEGVEPRLKHYSALLGQRVRALGRTWKIRLPLRFDESLVLERPKGAVHVADVDPILTDEPGQSLEKLISMGRPVGDE